MKNRMILWGILGVFAVVMVVAPQTLRAQSSSVNAAVEGIIKDATGGVLPGVTVTLTNLGTGINRSVVSNEAGLYRARLLPLGGS